MKRLICAVLLLCLLIPAVLAEDLVVEDIILMDDDTEISLSEAYMELEEEELLLLDEEDEALAEAEEHEAVSGPAQEGDPIQLASLDMLVDVEVNDDGFLPEGNTPVYFKDHASGYWTYISSTERIAIKRVQLKKPLVTYYVADIRVAPGTGMFMRSQYEDKPAKSNCRPSLIALRDRIVYAQNADFYTFRVNKKQTVGHIIRNGKILYNKSHKKDINFVPNLDTMAMYPDGRLEMDISTGKTAEQYLADGATDVIAFGPMLVNNGKIVIKKDKNYMYQEPRSCIGMVEQGHFIGLLVEGRRNHSKGADLMYCAELMLELGCQNAINLDGGGSAAMLFMGESVQIGNYGRVADTVRTMPDVLCVGVY